MTSVFRDVATDSIRYWEPRRLIYNGVLAAIVIWYFVAGLPDSRMVLTFNFMLGLVILVVLANIAYCAAYLADVFAQLSGLRGTWHRVRWILLAIGIAFAGIITRFWAIAFFAS